ncbi:unnamed protein product, partial [Polarella glacialis]
MDIASHGTSSCSRPGRRRPKAAFRSSAFSLSVASLLAVDWSVLGPAGFVGRCLRNVRTETTARRAAVGGRRPVVEKDEFWRSMKKLDNLADHGKTQDAIALAEKDLLGTGLERPMIYNTVIKACVESGDVEKAAAWYRRMREDGIAPNKQSFGKLINVAAQNGHVDVAEAWLQEMGSAVDVVDLVAFSAVINAYAKAADPEGAVRCFHRAVDSGLRPDLGVYVAVIDAHAACGQGAGAAEWLDKGVAAGIEMDMSSYN